MKNIDNGVIKGVLIMGLQILKPMFLIEITTLVNIVMGKVKIAS